MTSLRPCKICGLTTSCVHRSEVLKIDLSKGFHDPYDDPDVEDDDIICQFCTHFPCICDANERRDRR